MRLTGLSQILMVKRLLVTERVGNGSNVLRVEDREKVVEDAELEAILSEDSRQTQEELSESLGNSQQAISKRLKQLVILQHDNARPHVAKVVKKYLETLKWEILPHPPYSPDVAPSDFHLFRSMAQGLADQHFSSNEEVIQCYWEKPGSNPDMAKSSFPGFISLVNAIGNRS